LGVGLFIVYSPWSISIVWLGVFGRRQAVCRVGTLSFSHQASLPAVPFRPDEEKFDERAS